jgi:hypothetical protein
MNVPPDVSVDQYAAVVIWCERFSQFIGAAEYRDIGASAQPARAKRHPAPNASIGAASQASPA